MIVGWPWRALDWLRDAVGLGDAEGLVLLPVGALAVPAAVLDEATAGAAGHFRFDPLAVGAGAGVVAGGGLLLHRHGFGRSPLFFRASPRFGEPSNPHLHFSSLPRDVPMGWRKSSVIFLGPLGVPCWERQSRWLRLRRWGEHRTWRRLEPQQRRDQRQRQCRHWRQQQRQRPTLPRAPVKPSSVDDSRNCRSSSGRSCQKGLLYSRRAPKRRRLR